MSPKSLYSYKDEYEFRKLLSSSIKTKILMGSGVGFGEFIIGRLFQRFEPGGKKTYSHSEGNFPAEFEEVVISPKKV